MLQFDIDTYVDEIIMDEKVYWDETRYTFDEFQKHVKTVVESNFQRHLLDGEIDDWDILENDILTELYD